ncbi:hypothetical protein [Kitasatospora indigofera]|uniref:hypothetical protein n=1 Tax=Kitasatospora indigofera TaxID=67307 RepID=UPI00167DA6CA|nr:hypothetical protein [Kitasatospora indigofera]
MKTFSGRLAKSAGVLGLAVAALTTVSASPATASTSATAGCTKYYRYDNIQVQVDNCSDGWVWIYTEKGSFSKGIVHVTNSDNGGEAGVLEAAQGKSNASKFVQVRSITICGVQQYSWAPPTWWTYCANTINL